MSRWKASGIHLLICGFIAATVVAVMLLVWYPQPYFEALGGMRLLIILLCVDIVLGPMITLIIYNEKKKSLKFDLAFIGFVQLAALFYGVSVLFEARPVYLVFTVDRFEVVSARDLLPEEIEKVTDENYKSLSITGPKLVTALSPTNLDERQHILFSSLGGGPDLQGMPRYYVPYKDTKEHVIARIQSLEGLSKVRDDFKTEIISHAQKEGYKQEAVGYIPVRAGNVYITAIMNRETADIIKLVKVDPWET